MVLTSFLDSLPLYSLPKNLLQFWGIFFFFFTFEEIPDIPSQMRNLIMGKKMKGASEITFHKVTLVLKDIIRWEPKNLTLTFPDTFQAFWLKLLHLHHQRDLPLQ